MWPAGPTFAMPALVDQRLAMSECDLISSKGDLKAA